jgi:predicted O-linked N-acetylglucosamine transferase (SPINDLY family)
MQAAAGHQIAGRFVEAGKIYDRLQRVAPDDFQVNHLLGVLRQQQGRPAEAVALLTKARRSIPFSAPTIMCLGLALDALGRTGEAQKMLRMSVRLDPKSAEALVNLASHFGKLGQAEEAITHFRRALVLRPDYPQAWTGLGTVLHLAGRSGEAVSCHGRALALDPADRQARFGRGQALQALTRIDEALEDFDAHLNLRPEHHEARSFRLFLLNYRDDLSREALFAEHLAYGRAVEAGLRRPSAARFTQAPDPDRRIRLAFLSPDLRAHSVSYFLEPLLQRIDRRQFEVILYHDHFAVDAVSERLRSDVSIWRHLSGHADNVVEQTIRADRPDVLVDLAGHTGFNRLELFARRLAPVQITYLGYPNTTGLSAMDYRFTDAIADPPGDADGLCVERLVRFAPTAWSYLAPPDAPVPVRSADAAGESITFGSFNMLSKASASTLRLWRDVLAAVPGSRLLIKSSGMDPDAWRARLAGAGLPAGRVELLPMTRGIPEHLARYNQVDIALDCFPYHGTTTTCEALWMGVPVVTLAGDRHASRVGASLLSAVGHPEWVAASPEDYVRIAACLASEPDRLRALRSGLRKEMMRSPLMDHGAHAEGFCAAVRTCWQAWCAACESAAEPAMASS